MIDESCQCCRCKKVHLHSERKEKYNFKTGMTDLVCPSCSAKSFYSVKSGLKTAILKYSKGKT